MSKVADRVRETTTTTGTGTLSLAGAVLGRRTFVAGIGSGNPCYFVIEDPVTGDFEVNTGVVTAGVPDTLSRNTPLVSSNGGALVNFGAGIKNVWCDAPAAILQPAELIAPNQSANYNGGAAYTLFTPPVSGLYRVTVFSIVTTVDGVSSTLPSNTVGWTDPTSNVAQSWLATVTQAGNTTTTWIENTAIIHAKAGSPITLTQASYASNTPNTMVFTLAATVELI
jgi:hypothetical protein